MEILEAWPPTARPRMFVTDMAAARHNRLVEN
jgi:hypothetical protein